MLSENSISTGSGAFKSVALLLALGGAVVLLAAGLKILSTIDPEQLGMLQ